MDDDFVVRRATSAHDLMFVMQLAPHVGPHDIEAFFSADPTGFFIGELRGRKISHISAVKYPHMIHFALYVVDGKYRERVRNADM